MIGGIAAAVVLVAGIVFAVVYFVRKRKNANAEFDEADWDPDTVRRQSAILLDDEFDPSSNNAGMAGGAGGRWNPRPPTMIERKLASQPSMAGRGAGGGIAGMNANTNTAFGGAWAPDFPPQAAGDNLAPGMAPSFEPGMVVNHNGSHDGHGSQEGHYVDMDRGDQYGEMNRRLSGGGESPFSDPAALASAGLSAPPAARTSPTRHHYGPSDFAQGQGQYQSHYQPQSQEALDSNFQPSAYEPSPMGMGPGGKVRRPGLAVVNDPSSGGRRETVYEDEALYGGI
jgi:hypothetical protein